MSSFLKIGLCTVAYSDEKIIRTKDLNLCIACSSIDYIYNRNKNHKVEVIAIPHIINKFMLNGILYDDEMLLQF